MDSVATLASVVFLKVQDFTGRSVTEQARLRAQLEAVVAVSSAVVSFEDRIVVDTPSGAAVVVLADPKGALDIAERSLEASAGLPLCVGVNYGPVQPGSGAHGELGLMGDGIASAATIADFAKPSQLLVSRSFREALAEAAPHREATLHAAGVFTDARVRTHELSTSDKRAAIRRRRRMLVVGAVVALGFLGSGLVARDAIKANQASRPPAILVFEISPRGDVFVDGESKGRSPPLSQIRVPSGKHRILVKNADYEPMEFSVDLDPGEQLTIRHSFSGTPGQIFRSLRDKLRF